MGEATAMKRVEETTKPVKFDYCSTKSRTPSMPSHGGPTRFSKVMAAASDVISRTGSKQRRNCCVNVAESDTLFELKAEVPGFNEKEVEIGVEPRRVTITGKRETKKEEKKGKTVCAESCSDQILRTVELPAEIETDKVTATLRNGVLDLTLPKVAKAQALRIHPKAA